MADPPVVVPVNFATATWTARDPITWPPPIATAIWGPAAGFIAYPVTTGQIWSRGKR